jgi:RND family efflux transporter MFP subunit
MKKMMTIVVVAILFIGGMFLVHQKKQRIAAATVQTARTVVHTDVACWGALSVSRTYLARVEPWRSVALGAQIISRITGVFVREGDVVSKEQVLVLLNKEAMIAQVRGAEAGLLNGRMQTEAVSATVAALEKTVLFRERELVRDELLVREGAIARVVAETSADQLNEAKGRLNALRKTVRAAQEQVKVREQELEQARVRLAYTRITAPFDGVVTERSADPGELAGPNQVLVTIDDNSRFRICFDVAQSEMFELVQGMTVVVGSGLNLPLSVSRIHPALNRDRTMTVECDTLGAEGLRPGSTVSVAVMLSRFDNEVLVPEGCLVPAPGGGKVVFAVEHGVTVPRPVTVLGRGKGLVAVDGVAPGTEVVRSTYLGWNRLAAGEPVEVLP